MKETSVDTLVDDIYALLDENTNHEPTEENLDWIAGQVKDLLRKKLSSREREAATLRFSSLGRPDRQLWYAEHCPEKAEKLSPKTYFKFLYGDVIELLLLFLAKEAGHKVERLQDKVESDGVVGHIDAIIDGTLVDVKSASSFSYGKFKSGAFLTDDPFGYIGQISAYRATTGADRAGFLVADKVHGDIQFAEVPSEILNDNAPEPRIAHLRDVLAGSEEPPRCYPDEEFGKSGNRVLGISCSYCPFKEHCWRDANNGEGLRTFVYSTGPRFFTKIGKEPRVEEKDNW